MLSTHCTTSITIIQIWTYLKHEIYSEKKKKKNHNTVINSLRPRGGHHWSLSTLVQVIACCLMVPSHYLNQYWLLINWTLRNKILWNENPNAIIYILTWKCCQQMFHVNPMMWPTVSFDRHFLPTWSPACPWWHRRGTPWRTLRHRGHTLNQGDGVTTGGESTHSNLTAMNSLYPRHNEVVGGVYWFHSVRPSVRPAPRVRSVASTVLVGSISYLYVL